LGDDPIEYFGSQRLHVPTAGPPRYSAAAALMRFYIPNFPAYKTHHDFFFRNFRKNDDECILILVIYWKKTGFLHYLDTRK
jgi:hypothetical protein